MYFSQSLRNNDQAKKLSASLNDAINFVPPTPAPIIEQAAPIYNPRTTPLNFPQSPYQKLSPEMQRQWRGVAPVFGNFDQQ